MKQHRFLQSILWVFEGIIVGFGAIMPGISGGTLCVAFGMYRPLIELLSHPKAGIKRHGIMLLLFLLGVALGFVGLSGLASFLLEKNSSLMTCIFIGFILGTVPDLWKTAGQSSPRKRSSFLGLGAGLVLMLGLLFFFKSNQFLAISPGIWAYFFCGILWGLSFIVPGLSSSSLLLFFGLYQPMLAGITRLSPEVILPLGIGMGLCILLLSKGVNAAFQRHDSILSHAIIGIVLATVIMILPISHMLAGHFFWDLVCILGGALISFLLTCLCNRLKQTQEKEPQP